MAYRSRSAVSRAPTDSPNTAAWTVPSAIADARRRRGGLGAILLLIALAACSSGGSTTDPDVDAGGSGSGAAGSHAVNLTAASTGTSNLPASCPAETVRAGRVLRVRQDAAYPTLAAAVGAAQDGDTIELPAGDYVGDVAALRRNRITIRGVGGLARLDAGGLSSEGKGILVMAGEDLRVEQVSFANAAVPDLNGAGIRFESGSLVICNARFEGNENGILTAGDPAARLAIHDSVFERNGLARSGGYAHGLYVGRIAQLTVQGTYFTGSQSGHLLKSRARVNRIVANRLTAEGGTSSYEIDLPDGGDARVLGNLIEQSAATENATIVSFGAESMAIHPDNRLDLAWNTLVNHRAGGCTWTYAADGTAVRAFNNLLVGAGCQFRLPTSADVGGNVASADSDFVDAAAFDYRPRAGSVAAVTAPVAAATELQPTIAYQHPGRSVDRGARTVTGALEP